MTTVLIKKVRDLKENMETVQKHDHERTIYKERDEIEEYVQVPCLLFSGFNDFSDTLISVYCAIPNSNSCEVLAA